MGDLDKLAVNLRSLNVPGLITDILRQQRTLDEIIRIVKNRLYLEGTDSQGNSFKTDSAKVQGNSHYAGKTYQIKKRKGQRTSNVTFNDTGQFYRTINAKIPNVNVQITGDFIKDFGHIYDNFRTSYRGEKEFEDAVLSLTESQLDYLRWDIVYPQLIKHINKLISV